MTRFWLLDQHGSDGPTALVETDGRLQVVDVLRFGPSVEALDDQQKIWDTIVGRVAPTLKPVAKASTVDEEGIAPHPDLDRGNGTGASASRAGRRNSSGGGGPSGRVVGGPSRRGGRGER